MCGTGQELDETRGVVPRAAWAQLAAVGLLLMVSVTHAAAAEEIQSDRPEVTESARLLPRGTAQLETGFLYSSQRAAGVPTEKVFGIEGVLRIGVARDFEVNLESEPLVRVRGPQDDTGFGDVMLGVRYRFLEEAEDETWPPNLAVKPFVKLPVASEPIGSGRPDFGALLLASFALPWDMELEVNAGGAAIGQVDSGRYRAQAIASASLSRDIFEGLNAFVELFYSSRQQRDQGQQLALNMGLVYRITPTFAVDAGVQTSLFGGGPDYMIRTGLSVRFGRPGTRGPAHASIQ
jgi:Putative MetA-pathway of phenol degradation